VKKMYGFSVLATVLMLALCAFAQQTPRSNAFAEQAAKEKEAIQQGQWPTAQFYMEKGSIAWKIGEWMDRDEIKHVLQMQQDAWNHEDLEGFMKWYWNSPELTFFSGGKENKGWQAALDRYKKTYQGAGHEMGRLEFANLRIEMLGPDSAFVRGEFHLTMADGKTPHGLFTLVFRKFPEGWKIVHDHSAGE